MWRLVKDYIERGFTEPVKYIFLPEMGLLDRRASISKTTIFLKNPRIEGFFFHTFIDKYKSLDFLQIAVSKK